MQREIALAYVHIGDELPKCLLDSLYQTLLVNNYKTKIYVILSDGLIQEFKSIIKQFNLTDYTNSEYYYNNLVETIPLSLLEMNCVNNSNFNTYKDIINTRFKDYSVFRNGFWISTTSRFYYLSVFMNIFQVENVFHIENDIMIYNSFDSLYNEICKVYSLQKIQKICMIKDSDTRVIPSLMFFPCSVDLDNLTQFITNELMNSDKFMNDMDILGKYTNRYVLPILPDKSSEKTIFDGAALGQYLGGVDYRNLPDKNELTMYNNPSRGFVNETAIIKPNLYNFLKSRVVLDHLCVPIKIPIIYSDKIYKIANLHIHSKQLYQFSSVFDIQYDDIISGDRILTLCDFVLCTKEIFTFHKNIEKYAKDVIVIKDFQNANIGLLNNYFKDLCEKQKKDTVKLFIYTHILDHFQKYIFPYLDSSIQYVIYCHNSDHSVTDRHIPMLTSKYIKKVYAQNIDTTINSDKLCLLPIGIANSMWKHGDLLQIYKTMSDMYCKNKRNAIYVNINPNTYLYRKDVLDKIKEKGGLTISQGKPYSEYLKELSTYRFCLCLRGNGIDTHRFWECLYLGVIPVILNNKTTNCKNFITYLKRLEVPFYEICDDNLDRVFEKYTDEFFDDKLYKRCITNIGSSIYNIDSLKLNYYDNDNNE
jgi:hypothetical protein